jgi:hypothetical protein
MHQQQVKSVISSLDICLTPGDGHAGRNMYFKLVKVIGLVGRSVALKAVNDQHK